MSQMAERCACAKWKGTGGEGRERGEFVVAYCVHRVVELCVICDNVCCWLFQSSLSSEV